MLTYLINSLFYNKKIDVSLEYVEKLKSAMSEYNKLLYDKYLFYYYNSLVINYTVKNIKGELVKDENDIIEDNLWLVYNKLP